VASDGQSATIRIEQVGDLFDLPLTVAVQYADGTTEDVLIKVQEAVHEQRLSLKGAVRRIAPVEQIVPVEIIR
jgi:hypothetical protein